MKTGKAGIALIQRFEGLELEAYQDSAGVWTIGWGHTKDVRRGQVINEDKALELLRVDLAEAESAVSRLRALNQNQFDALVSFTFNLGSGWMGDSGLIRAIDEQKWAYVPREITRWVHAGGKPLLGLARRRVAEAELFVS